jgi:predicted GTPase
MEKTTMADTSKEIPRDTKSSTHPTDRERVLIMGAAGRDFHTFNVCFRDNPEYEVVAFTAAQIPGIEDRRYPPSLSGPLYPGGIPIYAEEKLEALILEKQIQQVIFAYSDVSHVILMHLASRVLASGADFRLIGPQRSFLSSARPVISVCAVRTGCGKDSVVRRISALLRAQGLRPVVVRHPMPYGDLSRQAVQRFASVEDCDRQHCTIEEREEYEQHIAEAWSSMRVWITFAFWMRQKKKLTSFCGMAATTTGLSLDRILKSFSSIPIGPGTNSSIIRERPISEGRRSSL